MITILRPAVQSTVQDLGRHGWRHLGIASCGAMDQVALRIGNALVGNEAGAAALELCLPPAIVRFHRPVAFALTGATCPARLEGQPVEAGRACVARAGGTLELGPASQGARSYLCVAGGIDVPPVLGSRSTDLQAGLGGLQGRMLRRGDELPLSSASRAAPRVRLGGLPPAGAAVRVLPGPDFDRFAPRARGAFFEAEWRVAPQSNRMGYRLEGPVLERGTGHEPGSHAVFPGTVQVPPGGAPIVLMADAQATGGYPRMGTVIGADLWRLGQLAPGGRVRFARCERDAALAAWRELESLVGAGAEEARAD